MIARVVACRDLVGADLASGGEELIELEVIVAESAGNRRAAGEVLVDERTDDLGLEPVLRVDEVVGNAEVLGDAARVVYVVDGTAAALHRFGHALAAGEAALIPELQREPDDGVSLGVEHRGDGR